MLRLTKKGWHSVSHGRFSIGERHEYHERAKLIASLGRDDTIL